MKPDIVPELIAGNVETRVAEISEQINTLVDEWKLKEIKSSEEYTIAGAMRKKIKDRLAQLDEARKSMTTPLDTAKSRIMDLFRGPLGILKDREEQIKKSMSAYDDEQERIRLEAERKAQEEARKEEESEKRKLEKKAVQAEACGDTQKAEALREQKETVFVPTPIFQKIVPKVAGTTFRMVWKYRIVDEKKIPREYMIPDEIRIGKLVRAGAGTFKIDGIEIYQEKV